MAAGRPTEAVDVLAPQASDAGAAPALQSALAMCQVAAGDRSAAIRTFETLLAQSPEDFTSRLAYAECLERQVDAAAALPEYFRAVHDRAAPRTLAQRRHDDSRAACTGEAGNGPDRRRSPGSVRARVRSHTSTRSVATAMARVRRGTACVPRDAAAAGTRSTPAAEILLDAGPAPQAVLSARNFVVRRARSGRARHLRGIRRRAGRGTRTRAVPRHRRSQCRRGLPGR